MKHNFFGTGVALITPFHKHGTVDFRAFGKLIEHLLANDVDYLVALGTTAETPALSTIEKRAVIDFVVEVVDGKVPIVLGVGGNNTLEIVEKIKEICFDNISGILSVSPYYNKPQQQGIYLHYKTLSDVCSLPIIIYNVPGRTGSNITAETTLRIAEDLPNVVAIKEASGNMLQMMEIIRNKPKDFSVISGDDALTLPIISLGGSGVISVIANAFPKEFSRMVHAAMKGHMKTATELHYKLLPIMNAIFEEGSPSGIKAVLETMDLSNNNLRLPLVKVSKTLHNRLSNLVNEIIEKE